MILKETQQLIGSVGIIPDPKRENPQVRMLGYWLDENYWGKGYMTEAVFGLASASGPTLVSVPIAVSPFPSPPPVIS